VKVYQCHSQIFTFWNFVEGLSCCNLRLVCLPCCCVIRNGTCVGYAVTWLRPLHLCLP